MKKPIFVRDLTEEEEARLKQGLRSKDGFEVRRSQIILASARKQTAIQIGRELNCDDQTVRNVIKQFNTHGLEVLKAKSNRPHTIKASFSDSSVFGVVADENATGWEKGVDPVSLVGRDKFRPTVEIHSPRLPSGEIHFPRLPSGEIHFAYRVCVKSK